VNSCQNNPPVTPHFAVDPVANPVVRAGEGYCQVYLETGWRMLLLGFSAGTAAAGVGTLSLAAPASTTLHRLLELGRPGLSLKWVWAPLVDRLPIPLLTRRAAAAAGCC
jgi:PAT family beta-lactamase induction signal transducer AmpG